MRLFSVLALCSAAATVGGQQPPPTFRAGAGTVALYVTVQDTKGRLVSGLERADFEVRDNGRPADVTVFSNSVQPITMVLLVDMSSSMAHRYRQVRDSMLALVDALLPEDRVRLGTFGTQVLFTPFLTSDKDMLRRLLHYELEPGGPTPLWRAMALGIWSLRDEPGRRVALVVTDGRDSCRGRGCVSFDEVEAEAFRTETLVYAIGMAGAPLDGAVKELADQTGGGYVELADGDDMSASFKRLADELHQQYAIGFTPSALDGKRHRIDVRVRKPGLTARARKDYVATAK